jgi:hypothetical protein
MGVAPTTVPLSLIVLLMAGMSLATMANAQQQEAQPMPPAGVEPLPVYPVQYSPSDFRYVEEGKGWRMGRL